MNQREAIVTVLDFFAARGEEIDKPLRQAIKVLTKRAEVLRVRYERLHASPPEDIAEEPLIILPETARVIYFSDDCLGAHRVSGTKLSHCWFCPDCFNQLDPQLRKALQGFRCEFWPQAFSRAVRLFAASRLEP